YRSYPEDLAPSRLAVYMGHAGTALELAVPLVLLSGRGGDVTLVGLVMMLMLHGFITSRVTLCVTPVSNARICYGRCLPFWKHAAVSLAAMAPAVALLVGVMCVAVPLVGNLVPARVPFLLAMRYYAGNWAYSVWLFRGESYRKLDRLKKSSGWIYDQLAHLY